MKNHFLRLFHHADWANRRILASLQNISDPPEKARHVFAHVLAAEHVWMARLRGEDNSKIEFWPDLSLENCAVLMEKNAVDYRRYLEALSEERLNATMTYRNSKGLEFTNSVGDTLTHVWLHGSYHRGQVAHILRNAGYEPVNTDFITFIREGMQRS